MQKKYYMTGSEQNVYNSIKHTEMVTSDEVRRLFPELSTGMVYKIMSSLEKKGYLYRIKRNIYLVQKRAGENPVIENPCRIALALYTGYIGFSSALRLYDLIEYEPFTVFVVTTRKSGIVDIGNYTFRAVAMGKKAIGLSTYRGIYVSNIEKTFFDCFYRPQYSGGYETITKALYERKTLEWESFLEYFRLFASNSLCQRTGYVLDMMRREIDSEIPENVIEFFKNNVRSRTKLIPSSPSRGKFSADWKVLDNTGGRILGWYHGY